MNQEEEPQASTSRTNAIKHPIRFDSKFSKSFHRQIRVYIDAIFKVYKKKFKKSKVMNQIDKDFFWVITTYFINRRAGVCMNMQDIKLQYFRKNTSHQKSHINRLDRHKRLIRKIMK